MDINRVCDRKDIRIDICVYVGDYVVKKNYSIYR
jgi:hypothetical protein